MRLREILATASAAAALLGATGVQAQSAVAPPTDEFAQRPPGDVDDTEVEEVVVTAARVEQVSGDVAASVEVVSARELDRTPGTYITDLVKKNASVDVIQYPGGSAGVGLRGFRPEFSGTSQRVLLLLDGRPAGVTSLGNLPQAGVERVEVLKGAASALYGSSAMGGVVNFLTRRSRGPLSGAAEIGGGSFDTVFGSARVGGDLGEGPFDFDIAVQGREQSDDFDLGDDARQLGTFLQGGGVARPNTAFSRYSGFARLGFDLSDDWRIEARGHVFDGDSENPGAESDGTSDQALRQIEVIGGDLSVTGQTGAHRLLALIHATRERDEMSDLPTGEATSFRFPRETIFRGVQLQDAWRINDTYGLTFGADFETVESENLRFNGLGVQSGSSSPNDRRETAGVFAEATARWFDDRLIVNVGGRQDEIETSIRETALRPDLMPGSASFSTFNPRAGVVLRPFPSEAIRVHASAGSAFVAPLAREIAGSTESTGSGQRRVISGNPDLEPESADTYDLGVGYEGRAWGADLTAFRTDVSNKIETVLVTNTPTLRETIYVNASSARADGLEAQLRADIGRLWSAEPGVWTLTSTATYYSKREQILPAGPGPLRNVAKFKINGALGYDGGRYAVRVNARYVEGLIDQDNSVRRVFTDGRGGLFEYPSFVVIDFDARLRLGGPHELGLQIENLLDDYYFEKNDYPGTGRAFYVRYGYSF